VSAPAGLISSLAANTSANIPGVRGHKRYRSGAWRITVFAGWDPVTGKRIDIHETVKGPDNRAGAKLADDRTRGRIHQVRVVLWRE